MTPPAETTTYTVRQYLNAVEAGTVADDYILQDTAHSLAEAGFNVINNAPKITLKDDIEQVISGNALTADAKEVLDIAKVSDVSLRGGMKALMEANLPAAVTSRNVSYVVDETVPATLNLDDLTVDAAVNAQSRIDAFLSSANVTFADTVEKPAAGTVKLGNYSIADTAANIAAADAAILTGATNVAMADSMSNVANTALNVFDKVDAVTVKDTLAGFVAADADFSGQLLDNIISAVTPGNVTFTATDTPNAAGEVTADVIGLLNFSDATNTAAAITFENTGVTTVNLTASRALTTTGDKADNLNLGKLFASSSLTINLTASDQNDSLNVTSKVNTINLAGGNDTITLGTGADVTTVNLGDAATATGNTLTVSSSAKVATINGGSGVDNITLTNLASGENVTINGKGGADVITLGSANETVVLGDGVDLTKSNNGTASGTDSDDATSSAALLKGAAFTNDKIALFGDLAKFAVTTNFNNALDASGQAGKVESGKINYSDTASKLVQAKNQAELITKLVDTTPTAGSAKIAANDEFILVTKADADAKILNIWYVKNNDTAALSATDDVIVLLGTVAGTSHITDIDENTFITVETA